MEPDLKKDEPGLRSLSSQRWSKKKGTARGRNGGQGEPRLPSWGAPALTRPCPVRCIVWVGASVGSGRGVVAVARRASDPCMCPCVPLGPALVAFTRFITCRTQPAHALLGVRKYVCSTQMLTFRCAGRITVLYRPAGVCTYKANKPLVPYVRAHRPSRHTQTHEWSSSSGCLALPFVLK